MTQEFGVIMIKGLGKGLCILRTKCGNSWPALCNLPLEYCLPHKVEDNAQGVLMSAQGLDLHNHGGEASQGQTSATTLSHLMR